MTRNDSNRLPADRKLLARFFEKIRIDPNVTFNGTPCWLWARQINKGGYGIFSYKPFVKYREAYRIAYSLFVEPAPVGAHTFTLDHLCRVRSCVNPCHLEKVPERINILRGENFAAKHAKKTHCPQGHEFTPENTYPLPGKGGKIVGRGCRACRKYDPAKRRIQMREWARRRRQQLRDMQGHKLNGTACAPAEAIAPHGD
jgi:cytochrome c5